MKAKPLQVPVIENALKRLCTSKTQDVAQPYSSGVPCSQQQPYSSQQAATCLRQNQALLACQLPCHYTNWTQIATPAKQPVYTLHLCLCTVWGRPPLTTFPYDGPATNPKLANPSFALGIAHAMLAHGTMMSPEKPLE